MLAGEFRHQRANTVELKTAMGTRL
ncbi:hypothetical protein D046_6830A, partial [Vibrio parahaemolyticus V-223/04]